MSNNENNESHFAKNVAGLLTIAFAVGTIAGVGYTIGNSCGEAAVIKVREFRASRKAKKNIKIVK